jgi:hypothetical protein
MNLNSHSIRVLLVALIPVFASCSSENNEPAKKMEKKTKPEYTLEQWRKDVVSTYTAKSKQESNEDGVNEFAACFHVENNECKLKGKVKIDLHKQAHYFTPQYTMLSEIGLLDQTVLGGYITAPECEAPLFFLKPILDSESGWIIIKSISILADNNIILKKNVNIQDLSHEVDGDDYMEWSDILLKSDEIEKLRLAMSASKISIRITGSTRYASLTEKQLGYFKYDLNSNFKVYDSINEATKSNGGPECTTE